VTPPKEIERVTANAAEEWLRKHDPDYETESEGWKHVRQTGEYETPSAEISWGLGGDLETLVTVERMSGNINDRRGPKARGYVGGVESRACECCYELFEPTNSWNRFCSTRCQSIVKQRRYREKQREKKTALLQAA